MKGCIDEIVTIVAQKLKDNLPLDILILHSVPEVEGLGGIVTDPAAAESGPCTCYGNVCFHPGIIGALNKTERNKYCQEVVEKSSPAMQKRLEKWNEAKAICKVEAGKHPKGEQLLPYIQCMGYELPKRGIVI